MMGFVQRLLVILVMLFGSAILPVVQAGEQWEKLEGPARVISFPSAFQ
jgi:hypothetical protein